MLIAGRVRLLSALLFVLFCAGHAHPCTCYNPSLERKLKESGAVFVGEITGIEPVSVKYYAYSVRFKVDEAWKGVAGAEIEMFAGYDVPGRCNDLSLATGRKYLVYADIDKDGCLSIARECGPTAYLSDAAEEVAQLRSKFSPAPRAGLTAAETGVGALYVLSFLAGSAWLGKRLYEGR